ncbi:hypothetical protein K402DRAFT_422206 [Aulographum hederae CBS 113979]|uniref:Uncharacterized protein n=1 Tax=Aulographum hederae CBS 113979 TaxID=1176131 RepID=A0A6G1GWQ5_9PEZI|nr:hypothetical protein K402DRAFT_422206 [Aulographum hederae CBS 113979]
MLLPLLTTAALAATAYAYPDHVEKRAQCNRDNLLRCVIATPSLAVPFCSSVLSLPSTTATLSSGTLTTTLTEGTAVATLVDRSPELAGPKCVTDKTSYSPARITSACSCLSLPTAVTTTVPAATVTQTVCAAPEAVLDGDFEGDNGVWSIVDEGGNGGSSIANGIPDASNHFASLGSTNIPPTVGSKTSHSLIQTLTHLCPSSTYNLFFHHRFNNDDGAHLSCSVDVTLGSANLFHFDFPTGNSGAGFLTYDAVTNITVADATPKEFAFVVSCTRVSEGSARMFINVDDISLHVV